MLLYRHRRNVANVIFSFCKNGEDPVGEAPAFGQLFAGIVKGCHQPWHLPVICVIAAKLVLEFASIVSDGNDLVSARVKPLHLLVHLGPRRQCHFDRNVVIASLSGVVVRSDHFTS
ncbi:hypothetical protein [Sphingobium yanoikuyae]|uniref:hypothetical protein n=1 Tax=Sphingobium yanoikuyae TaxID=13690 RepID=UPI0022DE94D1|nr:hypothetical protein [Sphingobium yanoikuyae]WBQ15608.1 hypothetical protein PAE53_17010 [Sphingobium yanoikuyae]